MGKKFDIDKASNGDTVPCPYCKKQGVLASRLYHGVKEGLPVYDYIIVHKHGWVERPGRMGGVIPCEVALDGCCSSGKFGENFPPVSVEEDFKIEEEDFTL